MPWNADAPTGSLYCLYGDQSLTKHVEKVSCTNGLCWSLDNSTLYYIDSPTREVQAFDMDKNTGALSNRRIVIKFDEVAENAFRDVPDGSTIDADGMIWIAHWHGGRVTRWDPTNGKLLHTILVPCAKVTSVAFGGEDLADLYITTASNEGDDAKYPHAGSLFKARVEGVRGIPSFKYSG
jgi:sugar lactone lactonase YvrE